MSIVCAPDFHHNTYFILFLDASPSQTFVDYNVYKPALFQIIQFPQNTMAGMRWHAMTPLALTSGGIMRPRHNGTIKLPLTPKQFKSKLILQFNFILYFLDQKLLIQQALDAARCAGITLY